LANSKRQIWKTSAPDDSFSFEEDARTDSKRRMALENVGGADMIEFADEQRIIEIVDSRVAAALAQMSNDLRTRADDITDKSTAEALRFVAATIDWRTT
jgi:hypothetical protein